MRFLDVRQLVFQLADDAAGVKRLTFVLVLVRIEPISERRGRNLWHLIQQKPQRGSEYPRVPRHGRAAQHFDRTLIGPHVAAVEIDHDEHRGSRLNGIVGFHDGKKITLDAAAHHGASLNAQYLLHFLEPLIGVGRGHHDGTGARGGRDFFIFTVLGRLLALLVASFLRGCVQALHIRHNMC